MGESEEYPLLNDPNLAITVLRQAEAGPARLEDCLARLSATLKKAGEPLPLGKPAVLQWLSRVAEMLRHASLLAAEAPGLYRLTTRGAQVLAEHPLGVDSSVLETFPEFRLWLSRRGELPHLAPEPAFDEGHAAYLAQRTLADNPYPLDSAAHLAWENGWFDALDEEQGHRAGTGS